MPIQFRLAIFSCLLIITGIFTFNVFRALPSFGIIMLLITALSFLPKFTRSELSKSYYLKSFYSLAAVFVFYCFSFFQTDQANLDELSKQVLLRLPFLILALSFAILPAINEKYLNGLYYYFFILVVLVSLGTFINFLLNYTEITNSYLSSKVMPTVISHVRFSLIIAFSFFVGCYLLYKNYGILTKTQRYSLAAGLLFLFIFLHILSVRSGLLAFYLAAFVSIAYISVKRGLLKLALITSFILLGIPTVCYFLFPTFENKITNTIEDLKRIGSTSSANDYSLAGRIVSYKVALKIFDQNKAFGVGTANLKSEVKKVYKSNFPEIHEDGLGYLMPHNQYLVILAATGITGLLIFLITFYAPLFINQNYQHPLLLIHYMIVTVSFLFEGTLETQTGLNFTLIFIFLPLYYLKQESKREFL